MHKIKRILDDLQQKLDETFLNIQLYEKALDLFEDDQSTLDLHNKLKNGIEVEESQNPKSSLLSPGDRMSLSLPRSLSGKAIALVETLERKRVEAFFTATGESAEERFQHALAKESANSGDSTIIPAIYA